MLIVVNPSAGGGRAARRWRREERRLPRRFGPYEVLVAKGPEAAAAGVRRALERGETEFVAAGGDGTVNLVAATLLGEAPDPGRVRLGALGLGSSNDFHKPSAGPGDDGRAPRRIDFGRAAPVDVGLLEWTAPDGSSGRRPWLLNASIGTAADANAFFNDGDALVRALKHRATPVAIGWAALHTLLRCPRLTLRVVVDGAARRERVWNLAIVKNPHFTGGLRYDTPYRPASGRFDLHGIRAGSRIRLVRVLAGLARGRFSGRAGTFSGRARTVEVSADRPFRVECDGEVVEAVAARFRLLPVALRVCP